MNSRKRRSTVIGAALIFIGILAGVLVGRQVAPRLQATYVKQPQGGLSKATTTAAEALLPAGPAEQTGISFTALDTALASVRYADDCAYRPNIAGLVQQALDWDLSVAEPTVLIVHTHASESYTKTDRQDYQESSEYRTLNTDYNMVALGDALAALLEQAGITVLHDRQIHDYPSYNSAYSNSRASVQSYLEQYPSICLVLDLHRDAVLLSDGSQYAPTVEVAGSQVAQLMLVVGSDASGTDHPNWQENLALALKLQVLLEQAAPGITRQTLLRAQRYNQDLSPGAVIVEIGAAGNTLEQALGAVPYLAQAVIQLMYGVE